MDQILNRIFKAYDIRGKVGSELTPELCFNIGKSLADFLPAKGPVAVGRDMRPDSEELSNSLIKGLRSQGRDVWNLGLITSDMVFFAVGKYDLAGGVVITASHNSGEYNGIKIYRDGVNAVGLDSGLEEIKQSILNNDFKIPESETGLLVDKDISQVWVDHALSFVDYKSWPELNIAADTGNGMAGAILPILLPKLPLRCKEMFFQLDGTFPNHEANPHNPDNLKSLIEEIRTNDLDFGIAFDGDGDRVAFVDNLGRPVLGTDLLSLLAKYFLKKNPGSPIIYEVRTSMATTEIIKENGGVPIRTKAGRIEIGRKVRELGAFFGGETTGHFFFKDNYDADSGLISALVIIQAIIEDGRKLSDIVDELRRYPILTETNFEVEDKQAAIDALKLKFKDEQIYELDGVTITFESGAWLNLRPSNTEPLLRLNAEAPSQEELNSIVSKAKSAIEA